MYCLNVYSLPREIYRPGDRIKVLIEDVRRHSQGLQIILSRSSPELVRKLFEIEVSEIYDGTVDIYKVVARSGVPRQNGRVLLSRRC